MYFESVEALLNMDGHGLYVWSAYGVGILVLATSAILPLIRYRKLLSLVKRRQQVAGAMSKKQNI